MRRLTQRKFCNGLFTVHTIPILSDNYCYLIHDHTQNVAAVVDAGEAEPVIRQLHTFKLEDKFVLLTTHKHWDHSGGNERISSKYLSYPSFKLYGGGSTIPHVTHVVKDGESFNVGALTVKVLATPCHTRDHVLYHVIHPSYPEEGVLFSGDTLFIGCVGAFFEGTAKDMVHAIDKVSKLVPDPTCLYPGHEYTVKYMKFSASVDKNNAFIKQQLAKYEQLRAEGLPTVPSTIAEEKKQNMFMRFRDPALHSILKIKPGMSDEEIMDTIYNMCP